MRTVVFRAASGLLLLAGVGVWLGGGWSSPAPEKSQMGRGALGLEVLADGRPTPAADEGRPLRVAMSAAFVSEGGVGIYAAINRYLTRKLGQRCEFITGLAYSTIDGMLEDGSVDMAFVCGLPYVLDQDRAVPGTFLLVAPVMKGPRYNGRPEYYSDLIVRVDSPYRTIQNLRGRTYVYNDELSNSGYNMPRFRLLKLGETKGFFGKVLRSGSHEESIRMVATGEADASFVDSLVLDYDRAKGRGFAAKVRVIESLGPAGICPVVVSRKVTVDLRTRLKHQLLHMHEDAEGRRTLDEALVDRFVDVGDDIYDDIRRMKREAEHSGFPSIK